MTQVSPLHLRPRAADELAASPWSWTFASGAVAVGLLAADVAIGELIDGAPTIAEQRVVDSAGLLAVVLIPTGLGLRRWLRRSSRLSTAGPGRRTAAVVLGVLAMLWAATRLPMLLSRVIWHVSSDADEPLTTVSLALQLLVSLLVTGIVALFAIAEHRAGTRPNRSIEHPPSGVA